MEAAEPTPEFDLSLVRVRLIQSDERARWDALMRAHHYLAMTAMVGRSLRYVAHVDGHWLALLGWASPALKVASRDAWIGWSPTLQWQRLALIANNSRFLILPNLRVKNLASRILGLNLARLSADWQRVHGHGLLLAETFIDPSRFAGTCYLAANWEAIGRTRGFAKSNQTYIEHGAQKQIWVYPLHPQAAQILSNPLRLAALPRLEVKTMTLTPRRCPCTVCTAACLARCPGQARHAPSTALTPGHYFVRHHQRRARQQRHRPVGAASESDDAQAAALPARR